MKVQINEMLFSLLRLPVTTILSRLLQAWCYHYSLSLSLLMSMSVSHIWLFLLSSTITKISRSVLRDKMFLCDTRPQIYKAIDSYHSHKLWTFSRIRSLPAVKRITVYFTVVLVGLLSLHTYVYARDFKSTQFHAIETSPKAIRSWKF